jgi:hypothetical protein
MIYTLGDSFTKWHWATWSDWMQQYRGEPVTNLAYPGFSNDAIYWTIMEHLPNLTDDDQVYIMWTGANRISYWYDTEFVGGHDIAGFFPDTGGRLWFGKDYRGLYKAHPDQMPSYTHMAISTFDLILKTQLLLDTTGCDYTMMFWQNPWADTREIFQPSYRTTWDQHGFQLSESEIAAACEIMQIPVVDTMLGRINWWRFLNVSDITNPNSFQGIWEYVLQHRELVLHKHVSDPHPNVLAQHDWYTQVMAPDSEPIYRQQAIEQAKYFMKRVLPEVDYRKEGILNNRNTLKTLDT